VKTGDTTKQSADGDAKLAVLSLDVDFENAPGIEDLDFVATKRKVS